MDALPIVRLYLDTNVYTDILNLSPERQLMARVNLGGPGFDVRLSPTNVLEFLSTPDPLQRERLIALAQEVCSPDLFPEVESILARYIAERSADPRLRQFIQPYDAATGHLAAAWRETKTHPRRTLLTDQNLTDRFRSFKLLFDVLHAHYRRGDTIDDVFRSLPWIEGGDRGSIEVALKSAASRRRSKSPAPNSAELQFRSKEAALLLMVIVVCSGLTPFEEPIETLWKALDISRPQRIKFAVQNFSFLVEEGPLVGMALALAAQWRRRHESGNAFDLYHIAYLPLTHLFFTNDVALMNVALDLNESEPFTRVRSFKTLLEATNTGERSTF